MLPILHYVRCACAGLLILDWVALPLVYIVGVDCVVVLCVFVVFGFAMQYDVVVIRCVIFDCVGVNLC